MIELIKKVLSTLVIVPAVSPSAADENFRVINGFYEVSNTTITENLKINGEAILRKNTKAKKTLVINGKLDASDTIFDSELFSHGTAKISDSRFKNKTHFSGNTTAVDSQFFTTLTLLSQKSVFSNCKFDTITIKKIPYVKQTQSLYLKKGSIVFGDIIFESNNGKVYLDSSSTIKGKIDGGEKINLPYA